MDLTGNFGKVKYYIFESIIHELRIFLYLHYHSWTYITTKFKYHSRSFDIGNVPWKNRTFSHQQSIWIVTNNGEFKSSTASKREFRKHFKLSPRQLPRSYAFSRVINRFMAYGDVLTTKHPGHPRTKIIKENIDTVRNLVEEKSNSSFSEVSTAMNLLCGKFCGKHWENSHINLKQSKVLPINTNCVKYYFAIWGQLSINWNPSRKDLIGNFLLRIPFPQMTNFRQCK